MCPKTGRPKLENSKSLRYTFRLTEETSKDLQECADKLNTSKAQVIEHGIKLVKAKLQK